MFGELGRLLWLKLARIIIACERVEYSPDASYSANINNSRVNGAGVGEESKKSKCIKRKLYFPVFARILAKLKMEKRLMFLILKIYRPKGES